MNDDDRGWGDPSGDPGHSEALQPGHIPRAMANPYANQDAARMGLDRNTLEGAQLHFFSNLDSSRPTHKLVAWVALFLMFGLPLLLTVARWMRF